MSKKQEVIDLVNHGERIPIDHFRDMSILREISDAKVLIELYLQSPTLAHKGELLANSHFPKPLVLNVFDIENDLPKHELLQSFAIENKQLDNVDDLTRLMSKTHFPSIKKIIRQKLNG